LSVLALAMLVAFPAACGDISAHASAIAPAEAGDEDDDYGGAGGPIFWLLVVVVLMVLAAAGAVAALIGLGVLAILMLVGILSSSAIAGAARRKPSTFFRWLFVQLGAAGGGVAGAACLVLLRHIFDWPLGTRYTAIFGGTVGVVGGAALGYLFHLSWNRALAWLGKRVAR